MVAVAKSAVQTQDWLVAMTAAQECASEHLTDAADVVAQVVQHLQGSGGSMALAARGMPVLQQARRHDDVVQVCAASHM